MSEMSKSWLSAILSRVWSRPAPPPPPPLARIRHATMGAPGSTVRSATPLDDFSAAKAKPEGSPSAASVASTEREAPPTAPAESASALPPMSLASRLATLAEAERKLTILRPNWAETQAAVAELPQSRGDAADAKPEAAPAIAGEAAESPVAPKPVVSALDQLIAATGETAAWRHRFSPADVPASPPGDNYAYTFETFDDTVCLKLSNGAARAPSGGLTSGYNIRVSDELELAASEKTIRITLAARSEGPASARIAIAYSTNDVGNSGWQWREVGPDWTPCTIDYQVPKMKRGQGDFVGLLPSPAGQPGVQIAAIAIAVID